MKNQRELTDVNDLSEPGFGGDPTAEIPSESAPRPFGRGMSVGGLMAVMVPLALYCTIFAFSWEYNRRSRDWDVRPPHFSLGVGSELGLLFLSGILLSVYRRACLRESIVQWSVPPALLLALWAVISTFGPDVGLGFALLEIPICFSVAVVWISKERGGKRIRWPKNWILDSILVGFVNAGLMLAGFSLVCCFIPGFIMQARS